MPTTMAVGAPAASGASSATGNDELRTGAPRPHVQAWRSSRHLLLRNSQSRSTEPSVAFCARCRRPLVSRIPSHLLSPGLLGNQGRVSKVCQSSPRRPLRQGFLLYPLRTLQANARSGGGDSRALAGRISPEARLTRLLSCDFHLLNHLVTPVPLRVVFHLKRDSHDF